MFNEYKTGFQRIFLLAWISSCLLFTAGTAAQELSYEMEYFSVEEGLSDKLIFCVLEHSSGFVWVGTEKGLDRFDGYQFHNVPLTSSSIGSHDREVLNLLELSDGRIAIISDRPDDNVYDRVDLLDPVSYQIERGVPGKYDHNTMNLYIKDDTFYMGSTYDPPVPAISYIRDDHDNEIIIRQIGDRLTASLELNTGETLDLSDEWNSFQPHPGFVGKNLANIIYARTHNGLIKISIKRSPFKTYMHDNVEEWQYLLRCRKIGQLGDNRMLLSTEQKPLTILDVESGSLEEPVFYTDLKVKEDPILNVRGMHVVNDSIVWVSALFSPLLKLDLKNNKSEQYLLGYYARIYTFLVLKNGKFLLIGYKAGERQVTFSCFDPNSYELQEIKIESANFQTNEEHNYLFEAENGHIWYGSFDGLYLLDIKNHKILKAYGSKNKSIERSEEDFPVYHVLSRSGVLVIDEARDGKIWVGLNGGGINVLDPRTETVEVINMKDGLPNNIVCGMIQDNSGYWISTYNGLAYCDMSTKRIRSFFKDNGLTHDEFNRFSFFRDNRGWNWFGTMNGFNHFDPNEVLGQDTDVSVLLSEANYFNKRGEKLVVQIQGFDERTHFTIPSNKRFCSFKMAISDFTDPKANTFSYKLEPVNSLWGVEESGWRQNGREREIQFEFLPAGEYYLRIRGTTGSGIDAKEYVIHLKVKEFFYKRWWFIALGVLSILAFTYGMHRYRLAQALKLERLRTRLSSDLHDDVGSLLSGVAYQMELLEYSADESNKPLVRKIADSSRRAMSRMRDVVWAIDNRNSTFLDLTERMREFAEEILGPLDISYDFKSEHLPEQKDVPSAIRHDLLLIFKEFLANTVKHANATKVTMSLRKKGKYFEMRLQDNGRGTIPGKKAGTGQGLANMKMRAEKLNGSLTFIEEDGFGVLLRVGIF